MERITFKRRVSIAQPDTNASEQYQDQFLTSDIESIHLPVEQKLRYHAHTARFGLVIAF